MSRAHAENVIKNLIGEIVQQCSLRGHSVSEALVAFMVKAVVLDPRNGFNVDRTLTKKDVQKLTELCLDKLLEQCSPSLDTIKMQLYFDLNYTSRREFLDQVHQVLESKLSPLSRDITDSRARGRDQLDALYRQLVSYILLRSGMGPPTDADAVRQTTAALQSVFPQTEMGAFMVLLKRDKEQQLRELSSIVTGIRLFNRVSRTPQKDLDLQELMPDVLHEVHPSTSERIHSELSVSQGLASRYSLLLDRLSQPDRRRPGTDVPLPLLKQALYNVTQHQVFLNRIQADACVCAQSVELLQTELSSQMKLLKQTLQSKSAVPTATVFPLFQSLSQVWSGLQDEAELLHILSTITLNLQPFVVSQAKMFSETYLDELLEKTEEQTEKQREEQSSAERIDPAQMKTQEWLFPENLSNFDQVLLQFNGFCGYTLVERDGLLLPGDPHIGILKHQQKLFVFSSTDAAVHFSAAPDQFISEVAEKAKRSPELIQLLRLHQQFPSVSPYSEMKPGDSFVAKPISKCESGTQTDVHPLETNICRTYQWNQWELRRRAIKLADLRTRVTVSTQTPQSHMRRDNATQTWTPKDAESQTQREGGSGVPRPQVYLAGLRGQRDGPAVKVNLTTPVDQ
ncbi:cilia- and flagella-associated protein 206-like [Sphaeramia orbicularis]|uniref:cilia- and flagella-associated protein 206-like n=1 Tax=Sphaeramia orbicularis TaxID=375764 RepID=UPI00117D1307|nr:cilia- and flagella-associated protein 206-like [Sphaeramia orbicularis]